MDKVFDVSQPPIPFKDNSVDEVLVSHVLEHVQNWETAVPESHRVLKPGGVLTVKVPYGVTFTPCHVRFFMRDTFDVFIEPPIGKKTEICWKLTEKINPKLKREGVT